MIVVLAAALSPLVFGAPPEAKVSAEARVTEKLQALRAALQELKVEGENQERLKRVADSYLEIGDLVRAIPFMKRLVEQHGGSEEDYVRLSSLFVAATKDPASAIDTLRAGLEAHPRSTLILFQLSKAYARSGKSYAAISSLQRAIEIDPEDYLLRLHLANNYRSIGKVDKAMELALPLYETRKDVEDAQLLYGYLLTDELRFEEAIAVFETYFAANPTSEAGKNALRDGYIGRAMKSVASGDHAQGIASLERAIDLYPQDLDARIGLVSLLRESGKSGVAEESLRELLRSNPERLEAYALLGLLLLDLKRPEEAGALFQEGFKRARAQGNREAAERFLRLLNPAS